MIDERYTIVQEERFIEATRDSGYKSTASAISELADNAFQAGANKFVVRFKSEEQPYQGRGRAPAPVVQEVACLDDGAGMSPDVLRTALRFGGTTRFDDRTGMGRFGMGLPNSSVSQSRRLEVYTWQRGGHIYYSYLDIDEIVGGKMLVVPKPIEKALPREYEALAISLSGTVVIWKKCDRLDFGAREDTLTRELPTALGQTYRYYLASGKSINVNGREVKPFDPLFLMPEAEFHGATAHGASIEFRLPLPGSKDRTSVVKVRFSLLPEEWQANIGKSTKETQTRGIDRARGFSIVRAKREIDFGYFRLRKPHWTDSWWSCEIAFEPDLDERFGVTHTKQQIKLSERLRTTIEKDINANIATLADIIVSRGKKRHAADTKKAEEIARERDKFLRTSPEIRDKESDVAEKELRQYAEETATEGRTVEQVIEDIRDRPFLMDFENLPGAPFYRVRTFGRSTVVTLNREHAFFDKVYEPLCAAAPASKTAIELLLFSLAKAETLIDDDAGLWRKSATGEARHQGKLWYDTQRGEWSRILAVYLDGIDPLDAASES